MEKGQEGGQQQPQVSPEKQKRLESLQNHIQSRQAELQSVFQNEIGPLQQQLAQLQEKAQAGDQEAAQKLQELVPEFRKAQRKALMILEDIRKTMMQMAEEQGAGAEAGEKQFMESQLGELYENFSAAMEG